MTSPGLLRLVLASVVIVAHFSRLAIGTAAVELFFTLSGYWIYRMYDGKYQLSLMSGPLFIASRLTRLLPVFLLFNTIAILLHFAFNDQVAAATAGLAWLPNLLILGYASLPQKTMIPAWSLDIELQFYLVFPFLFPLLRPSPSRTWLLCPPLLILGGWFMAVKLQNDATNMLPFGGFFLLGVVAAQMKMPPPGLLTRSCTALAVLGLAAIVANPSWRGMALHSINTVQFAWNTGLNFVLALLLTPMALATVFRPSNKLDRLLGDLSYVVYCSHWIGVIVSEKYLSGEPRWAKAPSVFSILVVTYFVSIAVLLYFDRPLSRWRERWIQRFIHRSGKVPNVITLP